MLRETARIYRIVRTGFILFLTLILGIFIGKTYFSDSVDVVRRKRPVQAELVSKAAGLLQPFVEGEQLVYRIKSNGLNIGNSVLTFHGEREKENRTLFYITFKTSALGVVDTEHIYVEKDTFLPVIVNREIEKMGKTELLTEKYDQENGSLMVWPTGHESEEPHEEYKKDGPMYNAIALTYLYRSRLDLLEENSSKKIELPKQSFELFFKGEKKVSTYLGKEKAFYFASNPKKFLFWLSKGKMRYPLKIQMTGLAGYSMILEKINKV